MSGGVTSEEALNAQAKTKIFSSRKRAPGRECFEKGSQWHTGDIQPRTPAPPGLVLGLGPAKPGSDVAKVESLGGRARSRRGYAAISCLPRGRCRALRNPPGATPTQRSRWCASGFQGRTPLGIHVEVVPVCGRTGDNEIVFVAVVPNICECYGE